MQLCVDVERSLHRSGDTPMMQHVPVKSSMFASIAHDGDTLEVKFNNGATYRHSGVTPDVFNAMLNAPSAGKYYNENIRGKFAHAKQDAEVTQSER
jgi:hypothetical protein